MMDVNEEIEESRNEALISYLKEIHKDAQGEDKQAIGQYIEVAEKGE